MSWAMFMQTEISALISSTLHTSCMHVWLQSFCEFVLLYAAIVKPKGGPKGKVYTEEDWNTEANENAQGADAYRYSKVCTPMSSVTV